MKIKNKRALASGVMATAVGILALVAWAAGAGSRFLLAAVLLAALALANYSRAFTQKGFLEELEQQADERDRYLAMKTSHILLQISNYVLCGATFLFLAAYGAWKSPVLLAVAITLCATLLFLFVGMLIINVRLEHQE